MPSLSSTEPEPLPEGPLAQDLPWFWVGTKSLSSDQEGPLFLCGLSDEVYQAGAPGLPLAEADRISGAPDHAKSESLLPVWERCQRCGAYGLPGVHRPANFPYPR